MTEACPTTDDPRQPIACMPPSACSQSWSRHLALENDIEQVAGLGEHRSVEFGGVGDLDHELADRHRYRH